MPAAICTPVVRYAASSPAAASSSAVTVPGRPRRPPQAAGGGCHPFGGPLADFCRENLRGCGAVLLEKLEDRVVADAGEVQRCRIGSRGQRVLHAVREQGIERTAPVGNDLGVGALRGTAECSGPVYQLVVFARVQVS